MPRCFTELVAGEGPTPAHSRDDDQSAVVGDSATAVGPRAGAFTGWVVEPTGLAGERRFMSEANETKRRLHERLDDMSVIRSHVRLRVRHASLEGKTRRDVMEAELHDIEKGSEAVVTAVNHDALTSSMSRAETFRTWLEGQH